MKTFLIKLMIISILFLIGTTYAFELINAYDSLANILGLALLLTVTYMIYYVIKLDFKMFKRNNKQSNQ